MKLLVFGGTFNPVHNGHVKMLKETVDLVKPDQTVIIPSFLPPHKKISGFFAPTEDRLEMCRLAFEDVGNCVVSDIEIVQGGLSYTYKTLEKLKNIYNNPEVYMLVGADMFLTLEKWKNFRRVFELATICTVPRECTNQVLKDYADKIKKHGAKSIIIEASCVDISSTEVRRILKSRENAAGLIPEKVYGYILENGLYAER